MMVFYFKGSKQEEIKNIEEINSKFQEISDRIDNLPVYQSGDKTPLNISFACRIEEKEVTSFSKKFLVECPNSWTLTGGGFKSTDFPLKIIDNYPEEGKMICENNAEKDVTGAGICYAICCKVKTK